MAAGDGVYAIGWRIGLGFDKQILLRALRRYRKSCCRFLLCWLFVRVWRGTDPIYAH